MTATLVGFDRSLTRAAASMGAGPMRTFFKVQMPLILPGVVSGALLTEIVFSYPGQGYLLVRAVASLDYPLIQGLYLTITLAVLGANLLLDLVNLWLDPRLRRSS